MEYFLIMKFNILDMIIAMNLMMLMGSGKRRKGTWGSMFGD